MFCFYFETYGENKVAHIFQKDCWKNPTFGGKNKVTETAKASVETLVSDTGKFWCQNRRSK
jgi:hypothetical protein